MHLTTETHVAREADALQSYLAEPANFDAVSKDMSLTPAGDDRWDLQAEVQGMQTEGTLTRVENVPGRLVYLTEAQGLAVTLGFDIAEASGGSDLKVALDFEGRSIKGKMLMTGLKMMEAKMQSGLERMVAKLAQRA
ncbi:hypothetical protein [Roseobacter sp. HKCCA0434]|uniref:hypothetical protein n=1 Tax=Roseobacter sp. HKCCA0434 TaxID=3079297 RepID=UPI002905A893|nr:hypothetical protein [Roseobacter sp. HKCCA0434]